MRTGGAMQWSGLAAAWQSTACDALQAHHHLSTAVKTTGGIVGTA